MASKRITLVAGIACAAVGLTASIAAAQIDHGVPQAHNESGSPADVVSSGFKESAVATGLDDFENRAGVFARYAYLNDGPVPGPFLSGQNPEASKTEPDENTYVNPPTNPGGPTGGFDYGRHFLIQGHENAGGRAYGPASISTCPRRITTA